ncbi:ATP-binding protein [Sporomusa malonica]|uniref:histidine kinase n=1 Tax=Sporomusa malonica TaxID=112901 RepID=A0A1W2DVJ6_9FIRM|nr:ATP-binding protein [Sporomusa malonica]SMD01122.1 PAS domain S-box-containing protein [Sporomusa malonica]
MNFWEQTVLFASNTFTTLALSALGSCLILTLPRSYTSIVWGVIFGICSVLVMREGIFITSGSIVDFRHIILTLSGYIGGPLTAIITASIGALFRWHLGGCGVLGGIICLYVFAAFGYLLRLYKPKISHYTQLHLLKLGVLMALIYLVILTGAALYYTGSIRVVQTALLPLLIFTPLGVWACFNFYRLIYDKFSRAELVECLLNSSPFAIVVFDANRKPVLASDSFTKDSLLLTKLLESPEEDRALHRAFIHHEHSSSILRIPHSGDELIYSLSLAPLKLPQGQTGTVAIVSDITDLFRAKQALLSSECTFNKIFNSSPMPLSLYSLTAGRFIHINESFINHSGYSRQEIINQPGVEHALWRYPRERERLIRLVYREKSVRDFEFEYITKTGDIRVSQIYAELVEYDDQPCLLASVYDVTERRQLELQLSRLDRLNLVGQMAASIGHEVRNPMTTVRGFLQLLAKKPALASYNEYFKIMTDELDRANDIITEFLSLANNKLIHLKSTCINDIINTMLPLMKADAAAGNKDIIADLSNIPDLALDEKEIRQLLLNLVRNALEASPAGGVVYIRSFYDATNVSVVLSVTDEGSGIAPEVLKQLGTPFLTTKETGTGLGLPVCYSIADRHQAGIDVTTGARGTTFFVRFKISPAISPAS